MKNNHGVAYMDARLFRVHGGVHAYALDAASGRVLWDIGFREREGEGAPMAPIAWNGLGFVGNAGGDNVGVRGHVHALDAATGREVWRFDVIPDKGAARATWPSAPGSLPPNARSRMASLRCNRSVAFSHAVRSGRQDGGGDLLGRSVIGSAAGPEWSRAARHPSRAQRERPKDGACMVQYRGLS